MLLEQRSESPLPPPAVTAWGSKLASGSETWSSDLNFRAVSTLSSESRWDHRDLDYLHARFSSPITGRFLSVDSGSAKMRKPQTWNRYAYAIGNPLKYVDPDGNEIVVAFGDSTFRSLVTSAIAKGEGSHPRLGGLIAGLRGSPNVHTITQVSGVESSADPSFDPDASNGVGTGSTIRLSMTTLGEDGNFMTVLEALMHEMSHSEDIDTGTVDDTKPCDTCPPNDEQKAVQIENLVRGVPRTTYGGQPVTNPTGVPPTPKRKPKKEKTGTDPEPEGN